MASDSSPSSNALEVTVSELSAKLKRTVEDTFGHVRVRGELGRISRPASGHIYLDLKDDRATLSGIIWKGTASRLSHQPEEGLEVIATGKLTTYPGQSRYQIIIDSIEPAGAGALMALLEERRKKLSAEGLFDEARKQLLPYMPRVIGVVTSPTGSVIRDILHRLSDRFPCHVIVWPVRVQGETCGAEVANGIHQFNTLPLEGPIPKPDLIIVARGGGSLEDLWGFNDEAAVRAAANSDIPLISAVGHETDWTLIDHAADWRAPTPTAAAEKAVPVKAELEATLADLSARLRAGMTRKLDRGRDQARAASRGLLSPDMLLAMPRRQLDEAAGRLGRSLVSTTQKGRVRFEAGAARLSPATLVRFVASSNERLERASGASNSFMGLSLNRHRQNFETKAGRIRLQSLSERLGRSRVEWERLTQLPHRRIAQLLQTHRDRLGTADRLFGSLNYNNVLARGFAIIRDAKGAPVSGTKAIKTGDPFQVEMADGKLDAVAAKKAKSGKASPPNSAPQKTEQGSLF